MTSAQRVAKRRAALRAQGLRPRTFWLPDTRDAAFRERMREASLEVNRLMEDDEDMRFIKAVRYLPPE